MKFTFYLDDGMMDVKAGDKLQMTVAGKAPGMLLYGVNDENNVDLLNVGPIICSDPNDQNYLAEDKLEGLPEDITVTVLNVESVFGVNTITISIDNLENM